MKKIKTIKSIFLVFFLFTLNSSFATDGLYFCGGYYDPDAYYFNLFNQKNISQKAFYPFLRVDDVDFYDEIESEESENIRLWYHFFDKKYSKESLTKIIFKNNKKGFSKDFKNETQFLNYLQFAKDCEPIAIEKSGTWNYNEILNTKEVGVSELLERGLNLFEKESNNELKLRYAYQIIRLHHYGKMYYEAIDFFENSIQSQYPKSEIYYYLLDQLGGCYYNLKQYEKAAYTFLTVFEKSLDKKTSAFISYKFCTYRGAEGKTLLKTKEERANQIFITGLRQFSDELQDLKRIRDLGAAEDKQELLMIRIVNNLERESLRQYSSEGKSVMDLERKKTQKIKEVLFFADEVATSSPKNKEFWQLTSSYLSFLSGNINEAKTKLVGVSSSHLKEQKESLNVIYKVFSWDSISTENEEWLADVFKHLKSEKALDITHCKEFYENKYSCSIREFTFKQLGHYYFKEGNLAKAFLVQNLYNYLENLKGISSHKLIDQLINLVEKPNKNEFEKLLLKLKFRSVNDIPAILNVLKNEKGSIYLRSGDFKSALAFLDKKKNKTIPSEVFSNNIKECFNCSSSEVMDDKVYEAEFFSFLNGDMNKYNLSLNLKKLEDITGNEEEKLWKRKLANYLLANYFFNVSNTGYFRTVNYSSNYWYNYSFGRGVSSMNEVMNQKDNYYFKTFENKYNNLASKSKDYYRKTIELSTDEELNARCAYMIAKCELNTFYNNIWERGYNGYSIDDKEKPTREGFNALKSRYRNTQFYTEIKSKCGFFKHYDAH